jgi:uncharacterized membrane protein YcaP (DUF421 family)
MRRRIVQPARHLGLLAGLVVLPVAVFVAQADADARNSVLHVLVSFVVLMLAFRLLGKRELSRLSPFELVTLMLIPEILSSTLQGEGSLLQALAGLCTILALVLVTSLLSQRFPAFQHVVEASPTLLVADGALLEKSMNAERIAPDELFSEMRKQGIGDLHDVRFAVLETGGNITFVPRHRPAATSQAGSLQDEVA